MLIPPTRFFITKKIYHSLFVARTWQHFIDLLKRKNPRFTAFLDSNAYIKLAPNGARWAPALALRTRGPVGRWPGRGLRPRPAFYLSGVVKKTLTYLRRVYVSLYRYSLEVFPVSSLE